MFIGHFGVGFGAKSKVQRPSLGTYFLAVQFLDLLWPTFLLLGIERVEIDPGNTLITPLDFASYPISHSLLMAIVWGLAFGVTYWIRRKDKKAAIVLGLCVVSHWVLDLLMHRPDRPLFPGDSPLVGLGLWNSLPGTLVAESLVFLFGVLWYVRATTATNRVGSIGLGSLVGFIALVYVGNILGPPPPSANAIAWVGQSQWLIVLWAYWIDRNRESST